MMTKIQDHSSDKSQSGSNIVKSSVTESVIVSSKAPDVLTFMEGPDGITYVKSGSVLKLIERLVDPTAFDIPYMQAFMLTHRQFVSSTALLDALIEIFNDRFTKSKKKSTTELLRYASFRFFRAEKLSN